MNQKCTNVKEIEEEAIKSGLKAGLANGRDGVSLRSMKVSVFVAASLDGFIAREDGGLDWLDEANRRVPTGEDCGFHQFLASVDVLVMGRSTFEQVLTFGDWPYGTKKVVVMTSSPHLAIPRHLSETVSISSEDPQKLVGRLQNDGVRHLYIDGGVTIQTFLKAELLNEITITVVPLLLGKGKPLFGSLKRDLNLTHLGTKVFNFGYVQNHYCLSYEKNLLG